MLVDTHVHLDHERYIDDIEQVLERSSKAGVGVKIIPGADPSTLQRAVLLSERFDEVYFGVGVHPYDMSSFDEQIFKKYATHKKCVAIGECGLDYYRLEGSQEQQELEKESQKKIFRRQIELAKEYKKPLIVHIRDASLDAKRILLECGASEVGGVLHCYNADEQLLSLSNEGFYFGIGGVVTFKNAKKLVNVLVNIDLDKIVFETDAPYLTPHPYRGKRNEPSYIPLILERVAELLNIDSSKLAKISTANARRLFML